MPKNEEIMDFHMTVTFFLWMLRRWPIYEKDSKFHELFKNWHHISPNILHTQEISFVGSVSKLCPKPIRRVQNLLGRIWLIYDVLTLKIAKTYQNPNFCQRVYQYDDFSTSSWKLIFVVFCWDFDVKILRIGTFAKMTVESKLL